MENPYRPAPGSDPPALVGRDAELSAMEYTVRLTAGGGAAQPVVAIGLRGLGKTALLRRALRVPVPEAIVLYAEGSEFQSLAMSFRRALVPSRDRRNREARGSPRGGTSQ